MVTGSRRMKRRMAATRVICKNLTFKYLDIQMKKRDLLDSRLQHYDIKGCRLIFFFSLPYNQISVL